MNMIIAVEQNQYLRENLIRACSEFLNDISEREAGGYWYAQFQARLDSYGIDIGELMCGKLIRFETD